MASQPTKRPWLALILVGAVALALAILWYSSRPKAARGPTREASEGQERRGPVPEGGSPPDQPQVSEAASMDGAGTPPGGAGTAPPAMAPPMPGGMSGGSGMPTRPGMPGGRAMGEGSAPRAGPAYGSGGEALLGLGGGSASSDAIECDGRLRQLAVAFRMYTVDYDRRLPPARRWCDAIYPYISGEDLFQCPAGEAKYGYALNSELDGADVKAVMRPASTVLLFESSRNERNAYDVGKSLCRPPRHPQGNFTAYLDGHVRAIGPPLAPLRSPTSAPSPE